MPLTIAVVNLLAGLLLLTVGGTLIVNFPASRRRRRTRDARRA